MKIDTFVQLIKDLQKNAMSDDTDPNNTLINQFSNPFDQLTLSETVSVVRNTNTNFVWGDGTMTTLYDQNGNAVPFPSCGWEWSVGGAYS